MLGGVVRVAVGGSRAVLGGLVPHGFPMGNGVVSWGCGGSPACRLWGLCVR